MVIRVPHRHHTSFIHGHPTPPSQSNPLAVPYSTIQLCAEATRRREPPSTKARRTTKTPAMFRMSQSPPESTPVSGWDTAPRDSIGLGL